MSQLVLVAALAELAGWAFRHWFGVAPELPIFVWALVFSGTIGVAVTNHMTKMLIDPIAKLRSAMREVADGDFKVEAKCESRIQDVQDIYDSFNSMVRELNTTETLQTDFISDVSHEFKTPINAIEGYASLLEGEPSPEEQRAYVEKILFNTRRLSAPDREHPAAVQAEQSVHPAAENAVPAGRADPAGHRRAGADVVGEGAWL